MVGLTNTNPHKTMHEVIEWRVPLRQLVDSWEGEAEEQSTCTFFNIKNYIVHIK